MTQKRFSATQYALLTSIFALGRVVTGPIAGVLVDAMGWGPFFLVSIALAAPGLVCLHRFVPLGTREPVFAVEPSSGMQPARRSALAARGIAGAVLGLAAAAATAGALDAIKIWRANHDLGFHPLDSIAALTSPAGVGAWSETLGVILFGIFAGLGAAALTAARRGVAKD